ncbi:GNAT family N-acetyltransferase, cg3035/Rv0428c family, partial [Mycolicibacterium chitae]|uniref:GNAT family N-acetyltransferase, cg3035/Rv0428c family n=1 Tax=Mycolicibacterium chitae TaxID=1792 RepID=UPI0034970DAD|nr:hypothetical protein [Mycolicibacterium chitae]
HSARRCWPGAPSAAPPAPTCRSLCAALLAWGAERGAARAYVQVPDHDAAAVALYTAAGFRLHHSGRYVDAQSLLGLTI